MITKEKVLEILKNNIQKSVIGWAVEEDDFELVADELVKNCSIPDVVERSEQLCQCKIPSPSMSNKCSRCEKVVPNE